MPGSASRRLLWIGSAALMLAGCSATLSFWSGEPAPDFAGPRSLKADGIALEATAGSTATGTVPAFTPLDTPLLREAMEHLRNEMSAAGLLVQDSPTAYVVRVEAWIHAYRYEATVLDTSHVSVGAIANGQPLLILIPQYEEYPFLVEQRDIDWIVVILACGPPSACRDPSLRPAWSGYFTFRESEFKRHEAAAMRLIVAKLGVRGWDCPSELPEPVQQRCFWKDTLSKAQRH